MYNLLPHQRNLPFLLKVKHLLFCVSDVGEWCCVVHTQHFISNTQGSTINTAFKENVLLGMIHLFVLIDLYLYDLYLARTLSDVIKNVSYSTA